MFSCFQLVIKNFNTYQIVVRVFLPQMKNQKGFSFLWIQGQSQILKIKKIFNAYVMYLINIQYFYIRMAKGEPNLNSLERIALYIQHCL